MNTLESSAITAEQRSNDGTNYAQRALTRLSLVEVWERFSYYTLMTLLTLFLVAPVTDGGFGWKGSDALIFYGTYMAGVQFAPFIGGLIADRWLGSQRALFIGAFLMLAGHFLLALPHILPGIISSFTGTDLSSLFHESTLSLGQLGSAEAFAATAAGRPEAPYAEMTYVAAAASFYVALAFVAIGNGLFKPNISVIVGRLPHGSNAAKDAAFGTFWMYINVGGVLGGLIGGLVADRISWSWAFTLAGFGMGLAMVLMAIFKDRYIAPNLQPVRRKEHRATQKPAVQTDLGFLVPLAVILFFSILFGIAYFQTAGAISLFTNNSVDRVVLGFEVPTLWLLSLNPFFAMLIMPPLARAWRNEKGLGHDWPTTQKIAAGFILLAASYAVMLGAIVQAEAGFANPLWIVVCILLLTCAELMAGPISIAAVSRIAPMRFANLAMGGFFAAIGLGGLLSGRVGAIAVDYGYFPVFAVLVVCALVAAATLTAGRQWFGRHGI